MYKTVGLFQCFRTIRQTTHDHMQQPIRINKFWSSSWQVVSSLRRIDICPVTVVCWTKAETFRPFFLSFLLFFQWNSILRTPQERSDGLLRVAGCPDVFLCRILPIPSVVFRMLYNMIVCCMSSQGLLFLSVSVRLFALQICLSAFMFQFIVSMSMSNSSFETGESVNNCSD